MVHPNHYYTIVLMIIAVVISIVIMIWFTNPIRPFIDNYPNMQILGLAHLILMGFMLITEAAQLSENMLIGNTLGFYTKRLFIFYYYIFIVYRILEF